MDDAYRKAEEARLEGAVGGAVWEVALATGVIYSAVALRKWTGSVPEGVWYCGVVMAAVGGGNWMAGALVLGGVVAGMMDFTKENEETHGNLPWLTPFRAILMLLTIYSILAVDFPTFPRIHMKTHLYGQSLMDIGVGAFVFSHGVVMGHKITHDPTTAARKWCTTTLPLCLLGILRVAMVKTLNYHEHLTEYGVHWNFFFTLGMLPILFYPIGKLPLQAVAGLLLAWQGLWVGPLGGESYITEETRVSLIDKNKEGLFSLPGYLAIFTIGCLYRAAATASARRLIVCLTTLLYSVSAVSSPPSRRLCNPTYILLVSMICTMTLLGLSHLPTARLTTPFLTVVSSHSLAIFLVANVLTGVVNLSMQTLNVSPVASHMVLAGYMSVSVWVGSRVTLKL
eukprot:TRINITY_DN11862_c0_g1_i1.p1 TRINITY_DN11862_c0_g1~~TRINITY_DN11862_c0_g1_i1.p1  ORF type:complete len:397 (+),score=23.83 TRINITY_DN11862_c0_g1_i1:36-1226(+)